MPIPFPDLRFSQAAKVFSVTRLNNGKVIIAGDFTAVNDRARKNIARLNIDGTVDLTWAPSTDGPVRCVVADGENAYIVGNFLNVGSLARRGLAKLPLSGNGSPDPAWDPMGNNNSAGATALLVDGQLLVDFTTTGDPPAQRKFGAFDPGDGNLNQTVSLPNALSPRVMSVDEDFVYVGGRLGTGSNSAIVRYSISNGLLPDTPWQVNLFHSEPTLRPEVRALAFDNGFVYAGGFFDRAGQEERNNLCRFNKGDASLDPWAPGVLLPEGLPTPISPFDATPVNALALVDDRIHVGGSFDAVSLSDGTVTPGGSFANYAVFSTATTADLDALRSSTADRPIWALSHFADNIVAAGEFGLWGGSPALSVVRFFEPDARRDHFFATYVQGAPGRVDAFAIQPDGKLIVGGSFQAVGSVSRHNLARLHPDGSLDETWHPDVGGNVIPTITGNIQPNVSGLAIRGKFLYISGRFSIVNGLPRNNLARLNFVDGDKVDLLWAPAVKNFVNLVERQATIEQIDLSPDGNSIYLRGEFTEINGVPRSNVAKVSALTSGDVDQGWNANYDGAPPTSLALAPDGSLFLGGVVNFQDSGRDGVVKINPVNGLLDASWDPQFSNTPTIRALLASDGILFVGGSFSQVNGVAHSGITKLDAATGATDQNFDPATTFPLNNRQCWSLSLSDKAICGYFTGDTPGGFAAESMIVFDRVTGGNSRQFDVDASGTPPETTPFLGGFLVPNISQPGEPTDGISFRLLLSLKPPLIRFDQATQFVYFEPSPEDPVGVTHFQIKTITGGALDLPDGKPVLPGDYISIEQGAAGLIWRQGLIRAGEEIEVAAAVEESAEGTGSETSESELDESTTVFRLSESSFEINEGDGAPPVVTITIERSGPEVESVDYALSEGTAVAFTGLSGDFFSSSGTLTFPTGNTEDIFVIINNDTDLEGDETFSVTLSNPTGDAVLGTPATAQITIIDNDILGTSGPFLTMTDPTPVVPDPSLGVLEIDLTGDGDLGAWRLVGEDAWRDSTDDAGAPATGLATGNYIVEFKPADGLLEPSPLTVPVDGSTATPAATSSGAYSSVGLFSPGTASLSATLEPSPLAEEALVDDRAQWRRQGEVDWRDSEDVITGLTPGLHIVEFKPITGRVTPGERLVYAQADQTNSTTAVYLYETDLTGASLPAILDFSPAAPGDPAVAATPYQFAGQIYTEQGYGSGVVTKEHTVLTAAHVLFDDTTLTHVTEVYWFHQRHRGERDLPPVQPRGWYRFDGYATQREIDVDDPSYGPGVGSPTSQNLDAAAMYFLAPAGRGGSSGYFASNDGATNLWLISSRDKLFVGYPMEGIDPADRGKMHATTVANDTYTHLQNFVFKTTDFKTAPGGSGAPIFVRADDGELYPAAIYLGGTGDSTVRSIDDTVVDLMNRAETAGSGGGNSTGGGATYTSPGATDDAFSRGTLTAIMPGAETEGAWRVIDGDGAPLTDYLDGGELLAMPPGDMNVEFREVEGMVAPPMRAATVYTAQTTELEGIYTQTNASWTQIYLTDEGAVTDDQPLDDYDTDGIVNLLERAFHMVPTESDNHGLTPGSGTSGLPAVYIADLGDGERLTVEYIRIKAEVATDLTYSPEFADDLDGGYAASGQSEIVTEIDSVWERVVIQDDFTTTAKPERFARVEIELAP